MKGAMTALLMIGSGALLLGYLVVKEWVSEENIRYYLTAVMVISAGVGSVLSACKAPTGKVTVAAVCGVMILMCLIIINILFFACGIEGLGVTMIMIMGSVLGAVIPSIAPTKTKRIKGFKF